MTMANYLGVLLIAVSFFVAGILTSRPLLSELRSVLAALRDEVFRLRLDVKRGSAAMAAGVQQGANDVGKEAQKL